MKDFFKQVRILDGGMGQELLARGMEPNGTLWSANALLQKKYHKLLLDTHLDFIRGTVRSVSSSPVFLFLSFVNISAIKSRRLKSDL